MKFRTKKIKDPYSGRGLEYQAVGTNSTYSAGVAVGLSTNLIALKLEATPPFDSRSINEDYDYSDIYEDKEFKTITLAFSILYLRFELSLVKVSGWLHEVYMEEVPPRPSLSLV